MALPVQTPEQRAEALARAATVRRERAELKGRLKRGEVTLAEALREDTAARLKVSELLASLPGMGKVRTAQVMEQHGIAGNRRVGGLGAKQRQALAEEFAPAA